MIVRRPRCKWEDSIKINLMELVFGRVNWIYLARIGSCGHCNESWCHIRVVNLLNSWVQYQLVKKDFCLLGCFERQSTEVRTLWTDLHFDCLRHNSLPFTFFIVDLRQSKSSPETTFHFKKSEGSVSEIENLPISFLFFSAPKCVTV